jgi:hypothetical protein
LRFTPSPAPPPWRKDQIAESPRDLKIVEHFYLAISSYASVAAPLDPFDLARGYIDLEGAIGSDASVPVLPGNSVVTRRQRNPKPALIVGLKGRHGAIFLLYEEFGIRKRS